MCPEAHGRGVGLGKAALRWDSTGGSTLGLIFGSRDSICPGRGGSLQKRRLGFGCEVLQVLPGQLCWVCFWQLLRLEELETGSNRQ